MPPVLRKTLITIAVAASFGAAGASPAPAAEFHCSIEPCRVTVKPDGTGKTAHQYLWLQSSKGDSVGMTCSGVSGEGTLNVKTSSELTISNVAYQNCIDGIGIGPVGVKMNGCDYLFTSAGQLSIKCPSGAKIEWSLLGCIATIGEQAPVNGVLFHDAGASKSELTVEARVKGLTGSIHEGPNCWLAPGPMTWEFFTSNFILTAETDDAKAEMANIWWE